MADIERGTTISSKDVYEFPGLVPCSLGGESGGGQVGVAGARTPLASVRRRGARQSGTGSHTPARSLRIDCAEFALRID